MRQTGLMNFRGIKWIAARVVMDWAKDVAAGWEMGAEDFAQLMRIIKRWDLLEVYQTMYHVERVKRGNKDYDITRRA